MATLKSVLSGAFTVCFGLRSQLNLLLNHLTHSWPPALGLIIKAAACSFNC